MAPRSFLALITAIILWSSAFVGIRFALHDLAPGSLALLRYIVASITMALIYFTLPSFQRVSLRDKLLLLIVGAVGIGLYNLMLNRGEVMVTSSMASFVISMAPVVTTGLAIGFLGERLNKFHASGLIVSILGLLLITLGEGEGFSWQDGMLYILIATIAGGCYSVLQKPFLTRLHAIQVTTYAIWGGTLSLLFYMPDLLHDLHGATNLSIMTVIYLGVFPAAVGYLAWSYVLSELTAARATTFLYFQPFIVILLGWLFLSEVPTIMSLCGGALAISGVWLVNRSPAATPTLHKAALPEDKQLVSPNNL